MNIRKWLQLTGIATLILGVLAPAGNLLAKDPTQPGTNSSGNAGHTKDKKKKKKDQTPTTNTVTNAHS